MGVKTYGECGQCHRTARLDADYPLGRCDECQDADLIVQMTKPRPLPRESIVTIREEDVQVGFLTRDYVEVMDHDHEGWITVRIKHWAKKPYFVTRAASL